MPSVLAEGFAKGFLLLFPEASLFIGSARITGVHVGPSASKGAWGIMVGKSQTPDAQDRWSIPNPLSRHSLHPSVCGPSDIILNTGLTGPGAWDGKERLSSECSHRTGPKLETEWVTFVSN